MSPEQALQTLATLVRDDRLRFPNYREFALFDQALLVLGKLIEERAKPPRKGKEK